LTLKLPAGSSGPDRIVSTNRAAARWSLNIAIHGQPEIRAIAELEKDIAECGYYMSYQHSELIHCWIHGVTILDL